MFSMPNIYSPNYVNVLDLWSHLTLKVPRLTHLYMIQPTTVVIIRHLSQLNPSCLELYTHFKQLIIGSTQIKWPQPRQSKAREIFNEVPTPAETGLSLFSVRIITVTPLIGNLWIITSSILLLANCKTTSSMLIRFLQLLSELLNY